MGWVVFCSKRIKEYSAEWSGFFPSDKILSVDPIGQTLWAERGDFARVRFYFRYRLQVEYLYTSSEKTNVKELRASIVRSTGETIPAEQYNIRWNNYISEFLPRFVEQYFPDCAGWELVLLCCYPAFDKESDEIVRQSVAMDAIPMEHREPLDPENFFTRVRIRGGGGTGDDEDVILHSIMRPPKRGARGLKYRYNPKRSSWFWLKDLDYRAADYGASKSNSGSSGGAQKHKRSREEADGLEASG